MKLKLKITPKNTKDTTQKQHRFTVIDLERSRFYPQNFVCILPKNIQINNKPLNTFEKLFQNESKTVAMQLLEKALKTRPDFGTATSIRGRLKTLQPKSTIKTKCKNCGQPNEQKNQRHKKHPLCYECYQKRFTNKQ